MDNAAFPNLPTGQLELDVVNGPPIHLRHAGVSVVIAADHEGQPWLVHWGPDLGECSSGDLVGFVELRAPGRPRSALDAPRVLGLVPDPTSGYTGTPALEGFRHGAHSVAVHPSPRTWTATVHEDTDGSTACFEGTDVDAGWSVRVTIELTVHGLVRVRTEVWNAADSDLHLTSVRNVLPVGAHADELLDLTGRWCKERTPQRHAFVQGSFVRSARHGRTGHDASLLLVAGTEGFGFRHGEVWGVHTAWSGNHSTYAERTPEGESVLGGGELLGPGEITLARGESYASPWLLGSWSDTGLDAMSARLHSWLRAQSPRTRTERKLIANTWEATYFDHDITRLRVLADRVAALGVERFVLDDGWFLGRRNDKAGLGDWKVDRSVWPDGLQPLIDHVHRLGMDFGLWFEPEMVNVDSNLAREHPEWILRGRHELPREWRHQQVLDLQIPEAYAHVRDSILALLAEYDIAYIKWDHNRDLLDAVHEGRPAAHGQTLAFYRLLDDLRSAFPRLEIESCASGGGRIDAEILRRTDRVWASDTIDPVERQYIQRWTTLLVPPEMLGSHIGGPLAHTTGRVHRLGFRAATALLAHSGIEWNVSDCDSRTFDELRAWFALHKQVRAIIATATFVHGDHPDPAVVVSGVVAADRSEAWYVVATVATTAAQSPTPIRLPGLDPDRRYQLRCVTPPGDQHSTDMGSTWVISGLTTTGRVLEYAGIRIPAQAPETAQVYRAAVVH